jgi:hypothetical protein
MAPVVLPVRPLKSPMGAPPLSTIGITAHVLKTSGLTMAYSRDALPVVMRRQAEPTSYRNASTVLPTDAVLVAPLEIAAMNARSVSSATAVRNS